MYDIVPSSVVWCLSWNYLSIVMQVINQSTMVVFLAPTRYARKKYRFAIYLIVLRFLDSMHIMCIIKNPIPVWSINKWKRASSRASWQFCYFRIVEDI